MFDSVVAMTRKTEIRKARRIGHKEREDKSNCAVLCLMVVALTSDDKKLIRLPCRAVEIRNMWNS